MPIQEQVLRHWIDHFYGYGAWRAPIWFVSLEESGGELPEDVAERINYFYNTHPSKDATICDIRELYSHLGFRQDGSRAGMFSNYYEYRFGPNAILHGVWKNLIAFAHAYRNEPLASVSDYQKHAFVSSSLHREALIRLYPLPSPHIHAWYYSWLQMPELPFLKSRALYQEQLYQQRIQTIIANIEKFKPALVLMYGMENINTLKRSFQDSFNDVQFKMIKAIKRVIPQYHRTELGDTTLLITTQIPALRHGRVETGFDWTEFGRSIAK